MSLTPIGAVSHSDMTTNQVPMTESLGGPPMPTNPPQRPVRQKYSVPLAAMAFGAELAADNANSASPCLNLSADLADALMQDHPELCSPIPNSQENQTPASLPKNMRRARSSSRTPLLGQFVPIHDYDKDEMMRSNSVQVPSSQFQFTGKYGPAEVK